MLTSHTLHNPVLHVLVFTGLDYCNNRWGKGLHLATEPEGYPAAFPPTAAGTAEEQGAASSCAQTCDHLTIPNEEMGVVIGTGGTTIKELRNRTGAEILISRRADANGQRTVTISSSSKDVVASAKSLLMAIIDPPGNVGEISDGLANISLGAGGSSSSSSSNIDHVSQQLSRLVIGGSGTVFAYRDMEALIKDASSLGCDTDGVVGAQELARNGGVLPIDMSRVIWRPRSTCGFWRRR